MNTLAFQTIDKASISLYPNPVTDYLQINGIEGTALLIIGDLKCRVMLTRQITGNESISLSTLPKGVYIAKIKTTTGTVEKKLIKD